MARVGVCTLPTVRSSPKASVQARDRFMPTSQSARLRPRAAAASGSSSRPSRSRSKPRRMASAVSDEIHSRDTGLLQPAAS